MSGIYVAYDSQNRHYHYAVHPDSCRTPAEREDAKAEVGRMRRKIRAEGGSLRILTPDEFTSIQADLQKRKRLPKMLGVEA